MKIEVAFSFNPLIVNKPPTEKMGLMVSRFKPGFGDIDYFAEVVKNGFTQTPALLVPNDGTNPPVKHDRNFAGAQLVFIDMDNTQDYPIPGSRKRNKGKIAPEKYITVEQMVSNPFIQEQAFCIYTTPGYTEDWHKFRIVFAYPCIINSPAVYANLIYSVVSLFPTADPQPTAISNAFFGNTEAKIFKFNNYLSFTRCYDENLCLL